MKAATKCVICGKELKKDWIALHKKLLDVNAKEFQCIDFLLHICLLISKECLIQNL